MSILVIFGRTIQSITQTMYMYMVNSNTEIWLTQNFLRISLWNKAVGPVLELINVDCNNYDIIVQLPSNGRQRLCIMWTN